MTTGDPNLGAETTDASTHAPIGEPTSATVLETGAATQEGPLHGAAGAAFPRLVEHSVAVGAYRGALKRSKLCEDPKQEWLRHLHKEYHARFLADNQRIWLSAQILIPASLIPLAALAAFKQPPPVGVAICLGLASWLLVLFWHAIAVVHKSFQCKNLAWMEAIEAEVGLETSCLPQRVASQPTSFLVQNADTLPYVRLAVVYITPVFWAAVVLCYYRTPSADHGLSPAASTSGSPVACQRSQEQSGAGALAPSAISSVKSSPPGPQVALAASGRALQRSQGQPGTATSGVPVQR